MDLYSDLQGEGVIKEPHIIPVADLDALWISNLALWFSLGGTVPDDRSYEPSFSWLYKGAARGYEPKPWTLGG